MQNREIYNPQTVERVAAALEKGGHNVRIIDGNINVIEKLTDFMPRVVHGEKPGMVFNMAYGLQGVSRYTHIPSLLEMSGIPYVGSSPAGHGVALDKVTTKMMLQSSELPTAPFWVFMSQDQVPEELPYPVIIKPKMEAVSMGIQVLNNKKELQVAVSGLVEEFNQSVLVEKFIPGREFAVGILGNQNPETLPIVEIDLDGDPNAIQSLDDKLKTPKEKICPALIDDELAQELRRLAIETSRVLGIYDFCRIDFRMDENNNLYVLELNSMASLGFTGSYVTAAKAAGYTYDALVNRMLDVAVERYFGSQQIDQVSTDKDIFLQNSTKKKTPPINVRLRSYLRGNLGTMEEDLAKMVRINSYVYNIEGVNSFGRWIANQIQNLKFQRQVYSRAEFGNNLYFSNHTSDHNDILILGNLDNAIPFSEYMPFLEERGRLYGTGISKGKGGLTALLSALRALHYTRNLKKVKCGILLISDESLSGRSSKPLIDELSRKSSYVLGLGGAGLAGEIITSCSGILRYSIEINRSQNKVGSNLNIKQTDPLLYASDKIPRLQKLGIKETGISIIITSMKTKGGEDTAPDHVSLSFRIHYPMPQQKASLEKEVYRLFDADPHWPIQVHVTQGPQRRPLLESEDDLAFYEKIERLAKLVEVRVKKAHGDIGTSLSHVPDEIPSLDGFGPVTGNIRSNNICERRIPSAYVVRPNLLMQHTILKY
ncbi:MAG: M20/M25/M40 family metallo-hydrolase [Gammaproteobacteria bacterium]|nr:M20/M25/M40 family metallo-hydrolase [Gammaproteobacteria bacterium]